MKKILVITFTGLLFASCVTTKKYDDVSRENSANKDRLLVEIQKNNELSGNVTSLQNSLNAAKKDISDLNKKLEEIQFQNQQLSNDNKDLAGQLSSSNKKVSEIVDNKSEHLKELSNSLYEKEILLNQKENTLDSLQREFYQNEEQIKNLKKKLGERDAQLSSIQKKLKDALLGFEDKGLTIKNKDGKVYVMMEEKLLFPSGSWQVSEEGIKALQEIAAVLANNPDIDVMVEGHTDNVPLKGKNQIKDNWDLSVMRASSITKILLAGTGISPNRIVPCGRGEYMPVVKNSSVENRAKNRRSEIILSPKVSELMDIIRTK